MTISRTQVYSPSKSLVFFQLTTDQVLFFDLIAGSFQIYLLKTGPGCLDGSLAALVRKPVILSVVIAAATIVLALFLVFVLLPSQRLASLSGETFRELQHDPVRKPVNANLGLKINRIITFLTFKCFSLLCLAHIVIVKTQNRRPNNMKKTSPQRYKTQIKNSTLPRVSLIGL